MVHGGIKPFKCETCGYICYQKGDLNRHVALVYEGKKLFKCTNKARFSWVTIINTWDEKKQFKCDICDKTFVAVHDGNKSFICLICKKIFAVGKSRICKKRLFDKTYYSDS